MRDGQTGYHIVTPLIRADGSTILVDRGFVSRDHAQQALLAGGEQGDVHVLGMLRVSQTRNAFTPDNHPEKSEWYWIDVDAMAEYAGGEKAGVQPVFLEAIFGACLLMFSLRTLADLYDRGTCWRGIRKGSARRPRRTVTFG